MNPVPFIDIHTHPDRVEPENIIVQNIFPGEGFASFTGNNFYSVGLHPWHLKTPEENNESILQVRKALEFDHVCFVGECGLDKKVSVDLEEQIRMFEKQVFISEEFKKPLIIHCVKAYNEILEIHKKLRPKLPWIMHGYAGSVQFTEQMSKQGFFFSFGKSIFDGNSKSVESLKWLSLEKIFFETDEFDGTIEQIYEKATLLKNVSTEILKAEIRNNFNRIVNLQISRF